MAKRLNKKFWIGILVLIVALAVLLVSCNGDEDDETPQPPAATTPTITGEVTPADGQVIDVSNQPLPRGVQTKNDLTLLASKHFVKDDRVYMMFLVRNDGADVIQTVKAIVSFIDVDNLRLNTINLTSPFNNIPPGEVVALQGDFPVPEYYDGISGELRAETGEYPGLVAYHDLDSSGELDQATSKLTGTATNTGSDTLVIPTAYFVLLGEETEEGEDVLAVIPAVLTSGLDEQGNWPSGATLNYEATVQVIAGDDLSAVETVRLLIAGYIFQPAP